jgi:hypothetical protein
VAVRKAMAGRDALVAERGRLELQRLRRRPELEVGRAVEPRSEIFEVVSDVPERERTRRSYVGLKYSYVGI